MDNYNKRSIVSKIFKTIDRSGYFEISNDMGLIEEFLELFYNNISSFFKKLQSISVFYDSKKYTITQNEISRVSVVFENSDIKNIEIICDTELNSKISALLEILMDDSGVSSVVATDGNELEISFVKEYKWIRKTLSTNVNYEFDREFKEKVNVTKCR